MSDEMKEIDISRRRKSVYRYVTSQVLNAEVSIHETSVVSRRERKTQILHIFMRRVPDNLEISCLAGFSAETVHHVESNYFPVLLSFCFHILWRNGINCIRRTLPVKRVWVQCLSTAGRMRQARCIRAMLWCINVNQKRKERIPQGSWDIRVPTSRQKSEGPQKHCERRPQRNITIRVASFTKD